MVFTSENKGTFPGQSEGAGSINIIRNIARKLGDFDGVARVRRAYFLTQHIQVSVPRHTPCFTTVTVTRWALVSYLFSLLTLETFDSAVMFAGGLAAALMEEAKTWLVYGGALAIVLLSSLPLTLTFSSPASFCSLVMMTGPYASHDASGIERLGGKC